MHRTVTAGRLNLRDVLELVDDRLNNRTLAGYQPVRFENRTLAGYQPVRFEHQTVGHVASRLGKELNAIVLKQLLSQCFGHVALITKDLSEASSWEMLNRLAVIGVSSRQSVRARMKVMVKRLLNKFGYPPDMAALAIELVLEQAELFTESEVNHLSLFRHVPHGE